MTARVQRDTVVRCESCGWSSPRTTVALAAHGMRRHSCDRHRHQAELTASGRARDARIDRTPRRCEHKRADHQHGTYAAYQLDGCRCLPCSAARSAYNRDRDRQVAYGTWSPYVPAAPAVERLRALSVAGVGWKRAAALAGVATSSVYPLLYGRAGKPPRTRARRPLVEAILAIPEPTLDDLGGSVAVDPTGTRRRVQALMCLGWSVERQAAEAGADRQAFDRALAWMPVAAVTARVVRDLYEQRWATSAPTTTHHERAAAARARNRAERAGWAPPAAWDEDDLDDPYALDPAGYRAGECTARGCPETDVFARGLCTTHYHRLVRVPGAKSNIAAADLDDLAHLLRAGETPERAATRVGFDLPSLTAAATRHGRDDVHQLLAALAA